MDLELELDARHDFNRARRRAIAARLRSLVGGGGDELLHYETVRGLVAAGDESYGGLQSIPVERIIGSEGRASDFSRGFLPRRECLRRRWQDLDMAYYRSRPTPAIKVYELGGVYFVRDGNHRVSVARAQKWAFIDAEVVRVRSHVALEPGMRLRDVAATRARVLA
jgi:hypothetical protein